MDRVTGLFSKNVYSWTLVNSAITLYLWGQGSD